MVWQTFSFVVAVVLGGVMGWRGGDEQKRYQKRAANAAQKEKARQQETSLFIGLVKRSGGDILFNYGPGTQYPRVSGASSLFTGSLAYSVWRGAQGEGEVEDQSRGHRVRD